MCWIENETIALFIIFCVFNNLNYNNQGGKKNASYSYFSIGIVVCCIFQNSRSKLEFSTSQIEFFPSTKLLSTTQLHDLNLPVPALTKMHL